MKYMGGKSRLAKHILPIMLDNTKLSNYVEPFCGGCNMIDKVPETFVRYANDSNKYLIGMFLALQNGWEPEVNYTKHFYKLVKDNPDAYEDYLVGYIGFNSSYSGKFFGGFAGKTLTKVGTLRDYQEEAYRNMMSQIKNLNNVHFSNLNYNEMDINQPSIIYCDPPYVNTTKYVMDFNHAEFWDWVREKSNSGHDVYVSEYSAPDDFKCIWSKEVKSSLSANGKSGGSKQSVEKLFVYAG
jgi:DNA adenine methylase